MSGDTDDLSAAETPIATSAADKSRGARRLLDRARSSAPKPARRPRRTPPEEQTWSGPRPDGRDPAILADTVGDLVKEREWDTTLRAAGILARWEQLVGTELAGHCRPVRLEAGELVCVAESTAWATQIRLLSARLLERLAADLGPDVVKRLRVQGPSAPDWRHGPLRVTGRGPRDTYG